MRDNKIKIKLYLNKRPNGVVQSDGTYGTQNLNDYYVNINLTSEFNIIDEYIDIQLDPFRTIMDRQLVNPWFNEFGFFESIRSTGITGRTNNTQIVPELQDVQRKAKIFSIDMNR